MRECAPLSPTAEDQLGHDCLELFKYQTPEPFQFGTPVPVVGNFGTDSANYRNASHSTVAPRVAENDTY